MAWQGPSGARLVGDAPSSVAGRPESSWSVRMTAAWITLLALAAVAAAPPAGKPTTPEGRVAVYLAEQDYASLEAIISEWQALPVGERLRLIEGLAARLGDVTRVGLTNTADLIIWYRNVRGDLKFQGHGHVVAQDLFITGGRAAHAIAELIGVQIAELNEGLPKEERAGRVAVITRDLAAYQEVTAYQAETDYPRLARVIASWQARPVPDRVRLAELLSTHLGSAENHGLKNHLNNVRIHYRVDTGDMPRGPFKRSTEQDLYIAGGKAGFAIEELIRPTGRPFPEITAGQTQEVRDRQAEVIRLCVAAYKAGAVQAAAPQVQRSK